MANKIIGTKMKEYRLSAGLTQQEAAERLGLQNKSTLACWEIGRSEPDGATLLKVCKLYGITDPYSLIDESMQTLAEEEIQLVRAYRAHPEFQASIRKLLDLR